MESPAAGVVAVSPFKGFWLWLTAGLGTAVAGYWHEAPRLQQVCFQYILVLILLESVTASQMQRLHAQRQAKPRPDDPRVLVYEDDDWLRAFRRLWNLVVYLVLASICDQLTAPLVGLPHYAVTVVLVGGCLGCIRAIARHIATVCAYHHFDFPDWLEPLLGTPLRAVLQEDEDTP